MTARPRPTRNPHRSVPAKAAAQAQRLFEQGLAAHRQGRLAEAQLQYERALRLHPGHAEALHLMGVAAMQTGQAARAAELIGVAIQANPLSAAAYSDRGNALQAIGRFGDAIEHYDRAIALRSDYGEPWYNRGVALQALGRHEDAAQSYARDLALNPAHAEAHNNRGVALRSLERLDEALQCYEQAIALNPGYAEAFNNRGLVLQAQGRLDAALSDFELAVALKLDYAEAHFDLAVCRLTAGDFAGGWPEYEWRWKNPRLDLQDLRREFAQPLWLGRGPLTGRTILLHAEQGLGDTLQFCRYAEGVSALGAQVVMEVQPPLLGVLAHLRGVYKLVARGDALPPFDVHCPLLSLPFAFGTRLDSVPSAAGYLACDPARRARWSDRLGVPRRPRVGLVWSGNPGHVNDRNRSLALAQLTGLLATDFEFVSLQREVRDGDRDALQAHPRIRHFGDELLDFSDTAALCTLMDVVVSVDTSVAHLAGALGRSVWILLPFTPDWRWMIDRVDSPWYTSARLYRQTRAGDWQGVLQRVHADLLGLGPPQR